MLATLELPGLDESGDNTVLAREAYLRTVIRSARNLRALAERHTEGRINRVVFQTAAPWKTELARDAIQLYSEGFDFKAQ